MRAPASTRMMTVRKGREDEAAREAPLTTRSWGRLTAPASARPWVLVEPLAWAVRRSGIVGRLGRSAGVWSGWIA